MAKYRIVEVDGAYIPQKYGFFCGWRGISITTGVLIGGSPNRQYLYCKCKSIDDAERVIKRDINLHGKLNVVRTFN